MNKEKCEELYREFKELKAKTDAVLQLKDVHQKNVDRIPPGNLSVSGMVRCIEIANIICDECKEYLDPRQLHELNLYKNKLE